MSLADPVRSTGGNRYNNIVVLTVALGSFCYGFNSSILGSATGLPSFYSYFNFSSTGAQAGYTSDMLSALNAVYAAGGLVGCMVLGWMADKLGRKLSIQIICVVAIIASAITVGSVNIGMLLAGRTLQGLASGMINTVCPLYHAEVSPVKVRGRMVGTHAVFLVMGYAGASWTGLGCYFATNPAVQWRLCFALQLVAPLLLLLSSPTIPESPRWLTFMGRRDESLQILKRLHYHANDPSGSVAEEEFNEICNQVIIDKQYEQSWFALWKKPATRNRMIYGFFVIFAAQSSGVLVINNYQIVLYEGLGVTGSTALLLLSVYTTWAFIMNGVNAFLLDRFGRRNLMIWGMIGAAIAISCETAMVATYAGTDNKIGNGFGVLFLFLFITFFAGGMDASSYVYASEIFPTWMRAQGMAFSVAGLFTGTLIYTGSASVAFASIGWKYYLVFIFVPLACVVVIYFVLPETNGLSLEEIGRLFGDEVAADTEVIEGENVEKSIGKGQMTSQHDMATTSIDDEESAKGRKQ